MSTMNMEPRARAGCLPSTMRHTVKTSASPTAATMAQVRSSVESPPRPTYTTMKTSGGRMLSRAPRTPPSRRTNGCWRVCRRIVDNPFATSLIRLRHGHTLPASVSGVTDARSTVPRPDADELLARWRADLASWAIPEEILAQAPEDAVDPSRVHVHGG